MQDFILTLLFNIPGIGAASGIVYNNSEIYLISDNSPYFYQYNMTKKELQKTRLLDSEIGETIPKKQKSDFEALLLHDDNLYAFGSGSTVNRNRLAIAGLKQKNNYIHDMSSLYALMRDKSGISVEEFNIEGVVFLKHWYFFQRGNGTAGRNGIFTVAGDFTGKNFTIDYKEIKLPDCNGIAATFTDATAVGDKIYFLGTAENSNSVYHDGEILGSIIGIINPSTLEIGFTRKISDTHKFEGLTLYRQSDKEITFLLCEDNDTEATTSGIYELKLFR